MNNRATNIKPRSDKLIYINVKELIKYKYLLFLFVKRDIVAQYKQTVLGPLWFIIQPVVNSGVFTLVFGSALNLETSSEVPMFLFFYLGQVYWGVFANIFSFSSTSLLYNYDLYNKVYFPRLITPLSNILARCLTFGIQLSLFLFLYFVIYYESVNLHWSVIFFPLYYILIAMFALGAGLIISTLSIKYRDILIMISFALPLFMFISPVIYSISSISSNLKSFMLLNPLASIFELVRLGFFNNGSFNIFWFLYSTITISLFFLLGLILFHHKSRSFVDIA